MAEVGDIEELLAALAQEDSRMQQHNVAQPPHDLSHMHDINFSLQPHSNMGIHGGGHLGSTQVPHCIAGGSSHMQSHVDILSQNIIEEAITNPQPPSDSSAVQAGSSLGSLFLDSVDEMLSNEKTTHVPFASPQAQPPAQRPKAKKPVQRKPAMDSSPLAGSQSGTPFSPGTRGQAGSGIPTATSAHAFVATQSSDTFTRRQQQNIQLTRPHSNASDSPFYPGSVPQASPVGSVDSNINPRTPLSNNPLTPQSVQPATPKASIALSASNTHVSTATPLSQMQQHSSMLQESDYLSNNPLRSPPMQDDQSHLQYLNTPVPNTQTTTQMSGAKPTQGYQQAAFLQGQQGSLPQTYAALNTFSNQPAHLTSQFTQPVNWQQTAQVPSTQVTSQHQGFLIQNQGVAPGVQNVFADMHQSFSTAPMATTNFQNPLYANAGIGTNIMLQTLSNYSAPEELTFSQNQILDSFSKGKSKPTSTNSTTKSASGTPAQSNIADLQTVSQNFQAEKSNAQRTPNSTTVTNMLQTAESGIKQMFSQSIAYEAISPASDHSPSKNLAANKEVAESPMSRYQDNSSSISTSTSRHGVPPSGLDSEERSRVGPLARRRSASKDQKQTPASKKADSAAFNFEDDFGFDQNEPTIRLPTKRNEPASAPKIPAAKQPNPLLTQTTMQRENYSDPSLYDTVQELAILQQKQKSLTDALNASRNKGPKVTRYAPKATATQASKITGNKSSKRRTSKTDLGASKTSAHSGQDIRNQAELPKNTNVEQAKSDELFFEQFLTAVTTKSDTTVPTTAHYAKSIHPSNAPGVASNFVLSENRGLPPKNITRTQPMQTQAGMKNLQSQFEQVQSQKPNLSRPTNDVSFPFNPSSYAHMPRTTSESLPPFSSLRNPINAAASAATSAVSGFINAPPATKASTATTISTAEQTITSSKTAATERQRTSAYHQSPVPEFLSYLNQRSAVPLSQKPPVVSTPGRQAAPDYRSDVLTSVTRAIVTTSTVVSTSSGPLSTEKSAAKSPATKSQYNADLFQSMLLQQSTYATQSPNKSSTSVTYTSQSMYAPSIQAPAPATTAQSRPIVASQSKFTAKSGRSNFAPKTTKSLDAFQTQHMPWLSVTQPNTSVTSTPAPVVVTKPTSTYSSSKENTSVTPPRTKTPITSAPAYGSGTSIPRPDMYYPPGSDMSTYGFLNKDFTNYLSSQMGNDPVAMQWLRLAKQEHEKLSRMQQQSAPPQVDCTTASIPPHTTTKTATLSTVTSLPPVTSKQIIPQSNQNQPQSRFTSRTITSNSSHKNLSTTSASIGTMPIHASSAQKTVSATATKSSFELLNKTTTSLPGSTPVDFSAKPVPATVSPAKSTFKGTEQTTTSPAVNILKDRTYHGPKKKHILEKYTQQTQNPITPVTPVKQTTGLKPSDSKPVADKPQLASSEVTKPPHSKPLRTYGKPTRSANLPKPANKGPVAETKKVEQNSDKSKKSEQSGSIFSLFDSLLEEATESAKDSLKSEPAKKKETKSSKDSSKDTAKVSLRKSDSGEKKVPEPTRRGTRASTKANTKASAKAAASAKALAAVSSKAAAPACSKATVASSKVTAANSKVTVAASSKATTPASSKATTAASSKATAAASSKATAAASSKATAAASSKAAVAVTSKSSIAVTSKATVAASKATVAATSKTTATGSSKATTAAGSKATTVASSKATVAATSKTTATASSKATTAAGSKATTVASSKATHAVSSQVATAGSTKTTTSSAKTATALAATRAKMAAAASAKTTAAATAKAAAAVVSKASIASAKAAFAAKTATSTVSHASKASDSSIKFSSDTAEAQSSGRTPATFPFKRRHFQNQSKTRTSTAAPTTNTTSVTTARTMISSETIINSLPKCTAVTPTTQASKVAAANRVPTTPSAERTETLKENISRATQSKLSDPTTGLKLRITAFRSAGGQVIYQSSLMGDLANDDYSSEDSDYRRRKRRKKRKKKEKRIANEIAELSKLLLPLQSKLSQKPAPSSDDDLSAPALEDCPSPLISEASDAESDKLSAKRRKIVKSTPVKILPKSSPAVDSDPEKAKQSSKSKKAPIKVIQRYKVTPQSNSQDTTSAISFNRQPGKPPLYLNAGANQTSVSGSNQGIPTIQLVPRTCSKSAIKLASLSSVTTLHPAIKLSGSASGCATKVIQPHILPKSTSTGVRYVLQTSNSVGTNFSPRVIIPKITPSTFSVGKATVFTVSSTGARVLGTPKIQIQPTPSQTSTQNASLLSPTKPVIVKRLPASILSKIAISSAPIMKISESATTVTSTINVPRVVSFTSKPVKSSSKIIAPKPVLATSIPSAFENSLADINVPQIVIPAITEAPDVNGKAQEKSKDEAEFQSAFTKLISSPNPLGKYSPPTIPFEFMSMMDCNKQQCYECGDSFLFNKSLFHHYDRRSVFVKVRCVQCNQMLVFFNKCEILRHAREHSEHGEVMQFNGANLHPIPVSLCRRRTKEQILSSSNDEDRLQGLTNAKKISACAMACTECSHVTDGKSTLEDHFLRRDSTFKSCDICKLPLHNECVYSAHMRMHRHTAPYTCPECGQAFDSNRMEYNIHLRVQCFHLSRSSCFKCKLCNLTFLTDDQLRYHLRQNHVQKYYKCRECPMAFKTTQNIANHQRSAHNLTPEPENRLKTIYKCPLCESVFTDSSHSQQLFVLHKHFDSHIDSARITAFKCYVCSRLFEQKASLRDHLQQEHEFAPSNEANTSADMVAEEIETTIEEAIIQTQEEEATNVTVEITNKEAVSSPPKSRRLAKKRTADEPIVDQSPKSRRPFKLRIRGTAISSSLHSGMQSGTLSARRASLPSTASSSPSSSDGSPPPLNPVPIPKMRVVTNHKGKKTYPCPECEKIFQSSHSRSSHVRSIHRGIRSLYCCTHCPVLTVKFAKRITLVRHLQRVHGVKNVQQEDIKIIRTQVPLIGPGEKFRAALIKVDKNGTVTPEKPAVPEKKLARKKITSGHARARRLAVQAGKRLRSLKEGLIHTDSEESYGEVDEKTVEEGWEVEDAPPPKPEPEDEVEVDASMFNLPDVYTCIKCDFQHTDRLTFQDHILEHAQSLEQSEMTKVSAALTMVQCTECGISFASGTTLDKHMHIRHKIKRRGLLELYDAKLRTERAKLEASGAAQSPASASGTGSLSTKRRCKVCFRKFDSESELKTHMRTHGLAFVKSKQH